MSVAQFPDAMDSAPDLHIWDNAAFDNGEVSEDLAASKQSWGSLNSIFGNAKASIDYSVSGKENQGFATENLIEKSAATTPFKPLNEVELVEKSKIKEVSKKGFEKNPALKIDEEIEEIESEIARLNSRLEALKVEKAASVRGMEMRGKVVVAKFMEQKPIEKKLANENSILNLSSSRTRVNRRGISLGPTEILSAGRRGMSLGPSEIFGDAKSRQVMKKNNIDTPLQSRRKSCLLKLGGIHEESVKRCSLSPKSRKIAAKTRQAVTTIASRKAVKKEYVVLSSVQPKKLFRDGEKSAPNKKAFRPGRVVASRYNNQNAASLAASAMRKRSLESDGNVGKQVEKKRSLSVGKTRANEGEARVKKRWEIPSEILVHSSERSSPEWVVAAPPCVLPRLRIACCNESPRDSGPAKKVAELVGRRSYFAEVEETVCQVLSYGEDEDEEC